MVPHGHSKTTEMGRQDPCAPAGLRSRGELLSSLLGLGWTWSFVLPTAASRNVFLLFREDGGMGNNPIQTFPRANPLTLIHIHKLFAFYAFLTGTFSS